MKSITRLISVIAGTKTQRLIYASGQRRGIHGCTVSATETGSGLPDSFIFFSE